MNGEEESERTMVPGRISRIPRTCFSVWPGPYLPDRHTI